MSFHRSISLGSYHHLKSEVVREVIKKRTFWEQNDPLQEDLENFVPKRFTTSQIYILCANLVKYGRPEIGKVVRYLPDKKKSACIPALVSVQIAPKICQGQLQTIYSECPKLHPNPFTSGRVIAKHEHHSNVPQCVSNTRRSFSFFPE